MHFHHLPCRFWKAVSFSEIAEQLSPKIPLTKPHGAAYAIMIALIAAVLLCGPIFIVIASYSKIPASLHDTFLLYAILIGCIFSYVLMRLSKP